MKCMVFGTRAVISKSCVAFIGWHLLQESEKCSLPGCGELVVTRAVQHVMPANPFPHNHSRVVDVGLLKPVLANENSNENSPLRQRNRWDRFSQPWLYEINADVFLPNWSAHLQVSQAPLLSVFCLL